MSEPLDLDALRATAEAATPGPWHFWAVNSFEEPIVATRSEPADLIARTFKADRDHHRNADYIATFDPPTIAALLDRLEAAEQRAELDDLQAEIAANTERCWPDDMTPNRRLTIIVEEVGEVARCIAKRRAGIRGTPEQWTAELRKEVGDTLIAVLALAAVEGFSAFDAVAERFDATRDRDPNHHPLPAADPPTPEPPTQQRLTITDPAMPRGAVVLGEPSDTVSTARMWTDEDERRAVAAPPDTEERKQ